MENYHRKKTGNIYSTQNLFNALTIYLVVHFDIQFSETGEIIDVEINNKVLVLKKFGDRYVLEGDIVLT